MIAKISQPKLVKYDAVLEKYINTFFQKTKLSPEAKVILDTFESSNQKRLVKESNAFIKKLFNEHPKLYEVYLEMNNPKIWGTKKLIDAQAEILKIAKTCTSEFLYKNIKAAFEINKKPI